MIKVEYLSNNKKYLINVINILKKWNNKSFNEKDITIIATENNKFIGFYQIKEHDNDNTSYSPWLANVFIVPQKKYGIFKTITTNCSRHFKRSRI